jgi:hypothetical protein
VLLTACSYIAAGFSIPAAELVLLRSARWHALRLEAGFEGAVPVLSIHQTLCMTCTTTRRLLVRRRHGSKTEYSVKKVMVILLSGQQAKMTKENSMRTRSTMSHH